MQIVCFRVMFSYMHTSFWSLLMSAAASEAERVSSSKLFTMFPPRSSDSNGVTCASDQASWETFFAGNHHPPVTYSVCLLLTTPLVPGPGSHNHSRVPLM